MAKNRQKKGGDALSPIEQRYKDILVQQGKIGRNISNKAFRELAASLKDMQDQLEGLDDSLDGVIAKFSDVVGETSRLQDTLAAVAKNVTSAGGKDSFSGIVSNFKQTKKLGQDLVYNQQALLEGELSSNEVLKDLGKAQGLITANELNRKSTLKDIERLEKEGTQEALAEVDALKAGLTISERQVKVQENLKKSFEGQLDSVLGIEKKVGLAGKLLKGFQKIPILGDVLDLGGAEKAMKEVAGAGKSSFGTMLTGVKALGPSLKAALGPIGFVLVVAEAVKAIIDAMFAADEQVTNIAKNLGISKESAGEVRDRLFEISDSARIYGRLLDNQLLTQAQLGESLLKFNELLGTSVDLTTALGGKGKEQLAQFAAVSKFLKLSEDEQKGLLALSAQTGTAYQELKKTVLATATGFKLQTGYQINQRKVLKEILTTSNLTKLSIKGGTEALIKSTLEAQKLGVTLDKINQIGEGFLEFESSIQSEMEAEVLLQRNLNLEKARFAALTNDTVTLTQEVNRLVAEAGPDLEKNKIAQQSIARALNMSTEELADYITKQKEVESIRAAGLKLGEAEIEAIIKASGKTGKVASDLRRDLRTGAMAGSEFYKNLQKAGLSADRLNEIMGEQAIKGLEAQSAQEKFNEALDRAKEAFSRFVSSGALDKFADFITALVDDPTSAIFGSGTTQAALKRTREESVKKVGAEKYSQAVAGEGLDVVKGFKEQMGIGAYVRAILSGGASLGYDFIKGIQRARENRELEVGKAISSGELPQQAEGGLVRRTGIAKVDQGEVYLGKNTRDSFIEMVSTLKEQTALLKAIKDKELVVETDRLAYATARATAKSYGNVLNSNSNFS